MNEDHEGLAERAYAAGFDDAYLRSIFCTNDLLCQCHVCLRRYSDGHIDGKVQLITESREV